MSPEIKREYVLKAIEKPPKHLRLGLFESYKRRLSKDAFTIFREEGNKAPLLSVITRGMLGIRHVIKDLIEEGEVVETKTTAFVKGILGRGAGYFDVKTYSKNRSV